MLRTNQSKWSQSFFKNNSNPNSRVQSLRFTVKVPREIKTEEEKDVKKKAGRKKKELNDEEKGNVAKIRGKMGNLDGLLMKELLLLARSEGISYSAGSGTSNRNKTKAELVKELRKKLSLPERTQDMMAESEKTGEKGKWKKTNPTRDLMAESEKTGEKGKWKKTKPLNENQIQKVEEIKIKMGKVGLGSLHIEEVKLLAREKGIVSQKLSDSTNTRWAPKNKEELIQELLEKFPSLPRRTKKQEEEKKDNRGNNGGRKPRPPNAEEKEMEGNIRAKLETVGVNGLLMNEVKVLARAEGIRRLKRSKFELVEELEKKLSLSKTETFKRTRRNIKLVETEFIEEEFEEEYDEDELDFELMDEDSEGDVRRKRIRESEYSGDIEEEYQEREEMYILDNTKIFNFLLVPYLTLDNAMEVESVENFPAVPPRKACKIMNY